MNIVKQLLHLNGPMLLQVYVVLIGIYQLLQVIHHLLLLEQSFHVDTPYYVMRDAPKDVITDVALTLSTKGGVSDPVETANGYYVLVRMEYDTGSLLLRTPDLLQTYQAAKLQEEINRYREETSITLNDFGKSLDLLEIR